MVAQEQVPALVFLLSWCLYSHRDAIRSWAIHLCHTSSLVALARFGIALTSSKAPTVLPLHNTSGASPLLRALDMKGVGECVRSWIVPDDQRQLAATSRALLPVVYHTATRSHHNSRERARTRKRQRVCAMLTDFGFDALAQRFERAWMCATLEPTPTGSAITTTTAATATATGTVDSGLHLHPTPLATPSNAAVCTSTLMPPLGALVFEAPKLSMRAQDIAHTCSVAWLVLGLALCVATSERATYDLAFVVATVLTCVRDADYLPRWSASRTPTHSTPNTQMIQVFHGRAWFQPQAAVAVVGTCMRFLTLLLERESWWRAALLVLWAAANAVVRECAIAWNLESYIVLDLTDDLKGTRRMVSGEHLRALAYVYRHPDKRLRNDSLIYRNDLRAWCVLTTRAYGVLLLARLAECHVAPPLALALLFALALIFASGSMFLHVRVILWLIVAFVYTHVHSDATLARVLQDHMRRAPFWSAFLALTACAALFDFALILIANKNKVRTRALTRLCLWCLWPAAWIGARRLARLERQLFPNCATKFAAAAPASSAATSAAPFRYSVASN